MEDIKQQMCDRFDEKYEICNNPDHGFIDALSFHDIGRLGCPGCGGKFNNPKLFVPSELKEFIASEIDLAVVQEIERINKFCEEEIEFIQNHSSGNYADGLVESLLKVKRFNQQ